MSVQALMACLCAGGALSAGKRFIAVSSGAEVIVAEQDGE